MACTWGPNHNYKKVAWYRHIVNIGVDEEMWLFYGDGAVTDVNQPNTAFTEKVQFVEARNESHHIKLRYVTEEDFGSYWCTVTLGPDVLYGTASYLDLKGTQPVQYESTYEIEWGVVCIDVNMVTGIFVFTFTCWYKTFLYGNVQK